MIYLLLAIVFSAMISLVMRLSEKYVKSSLLMLAMNYLMCAVMAALYVGKAPFLPKDTQGFPLTLLLGAIGGVIYLGAFLLMRFNIARSGVVLPATFMKLGILVPTVLSAVIFQEQADWLKWLGVALAVGAILLMNGGGRLEGRNTVWLVMLLLAGGCADFMSKLFEELAPAELQNQFLLYIFVTALMLCLLLCMAKGQRPGWKDALFGLALGIPNYLCSRFFLLSLDAVPAMVAFPTFSVGTILMVAAMGMIFFHEKLNKRKWLALGVILIALVLLNLKLK